MKDLKNLKGAKMISKNDQRSIKGGVEECSEGHPCHEGYYCDWHATDHGICILLPPDM